MHTRPAIYFSDAFATFLFVNLFLINRKNMSTRNSCEVAILANTGRGGPPAQEKMYHIFQEQMFHYNISQ